MHKLTTILPLIALSSLAPDPIDAVASSHEFQEALAGLVLDVAMLEGVSPLRIDEHVQRSLASGRSLTVEHIGVLRTTMASGSISASGVLVVLDLFCNDTKGRTLGHVIAEVEALEAETRAAARMAAREFFGLGPDDEAQRHPRIPFPEARPQNGKSSNAGMLGLPRSRTQGQPDPARSESFAKRARWLRRRSQKVKR